MEVEAVEVMVVVVVVVVIGEGGGGGRENGLLELENFILQDPNT